MGVVSSSRILASLGGFRGGLFYSGLFLANLELISAFVGIGLVIPILCLNFGLLLSTVFITLTLAELFNCILGLLVFWTFLFALLLFF